MATTTKHGGARKGAGRKRSDIADILKLVGAVPVGEPLKLVRWYANLIALLTEALLSGRPVKKHLEAARASSTASARLMPPDIIYEAQRLLDADEREVKSDGDGPALVDRKDEAHVAKRTGAIRRNPS